MKTLKQRLQETKCVKGYTNLSDKEIIITVVNWSKENKLMDTYGCLMKELLLEESEQ